ncbi:MAG: TIGR00341 family protein [Candidatus Thorarchaeota archaeon]
MKQIQVSVPASEGNEIVKNLNEVVSPSQIEHIKGVDQSLIIITVLPDRIGFVLDHLNDLDIGRVKGRITVVDVSATIPKIRPRKQDKFLRRISVEEMEQTVSNLAKLDLSYITWMILASILAAMGLINDDYVTLIASMIISPLMGPIVGIAFGAITSNQKILKQGVFGQLTGIGIAIFIGFFIGLIYGFTRTNISSFIISRGEPNIINLIIAIASGIAAGMCFVSGTSLALVGVAVGAALLPVMVNLGIAIGMFEWTIALGSLVLFVTNVACVQLGCIIVFLIRKVEPPQVVKKVKAKRSMKNQIIAWVFILLVAALPISMTTVQIGRQWKYEKIANDESRNILETTDGFLAIEQLDIKITGSIFTYQVLVNLRVLANKTIDQSVFNDIKNAIEDSAGRNIDLKFTVIISQIFDSSLQRENPNNQWLILKNSYTKKFVF